MRNHASFALALVLPLAVAAQVPTPTESMGSYYHTPEQKAMDAYGRGIKLKKKAEAAKEPAVQTKLYLKAKEELSKSAGYVPNYDAYLALGQVYLALGKQESALDACNHAQSLKPSDEAAKGCMTEAQKRIQEAAAAKPRDSGR
ncbi:MAG TPA: tetratricopeptide repeat protein [Thermoanaerobaculia bacterium]|jgi:cytochrome c-type biogenesis protein CcmH/NrfG|nr:tetratricopeptide repeat protein [Thermoanaerobaculia bacterium]